MKIKVEPLLPTGNFLNCRIGIEKDIPDDANMMEAILTEWDNLIAIHMKRYPHLYNEEGKPKYEIYKGEDEMKGTSVKDIAPVEPQDKIKAFKETLDMCKSATMLEKFKPQVDRINNPELTAFYDNKLNQLQ